jgi:hypothetical protein
MVTIEVDHVDTCFSDYLQDHRNIVGISLGCTTEEDAADALLDEVTSILELPESVTDATLRAACCEAVRGLDLRPVDDRGERIDDLDAASEEQPSAWFKVTIAP